MHLFNQVYSNIERQEPIYIERERLTLKGRRVNCDPVSVESCVRCGREDAVDIDSAIIKKNPDDVFVSFIVLTVLVRDWCVLVSMAPPWPERGESE